MKRRLVVAAGVIFMLVAVPGAHAQDAEARFRADVEKMLEVTGALALGTQMATMVSDQVFDSLRIQQPGIPARALDIVKEMLGAEFSRAFEAPDGLRGRIVGIHMKHFTHDEVLALLDFYSTDVGRKSISVMPTLAQEGAAAGQEWAAAHLPRILGAIDERLRAEGFLKR